MKGGDVDMKKYETKEPKVANVQLVGHTNQLVAACARVSVMVFALVSHSFGFNLLRGSHPLKHAVLVRAKSL